MEKNEKAKLIVNKLGGVENIKTYSHCSTRLRFEIFDKEKVDIHGLEKIEGVLSVVEAAGQYQVVIGSGVSFFFPEIAKVMNENGDKSDEIENLKRDNSSSKETNNNLVSKLIDLVSNLFTPILDVLIGAGILKGLISILGALNWIHPGTGTYEILNAAADALYYFLPLFIAITASKRFKTNMYVSVAIAAALLYPSLSDLQNSGAQLDFLGIPFELTNFNGGVFPIIFAIVLLHYVERLENKLLPELVRSRIAPFFSLLIVVPCTIIVFGPLGSMLSNAIATAYQTIYSWNSVLAGGFIGALAQVMVVFGIHWGLFPIIFSNIESFGYDTILAVFGPSIIAQSGAALGIYLRTKDQELKKVSLPATFMGFFGISEPAIYGVTLKYRKAFLMAMIGGGIGGAIAGASGARALAVAVASVPTFPAYFGDGFIGFLIGYFGAFILSAGLTYFLGYDEDINLDKVSK